ncbi:MAG: hypothetical protein IJD38_06335 [Clostridia bacterium]|nr:hypothetical protein [Clostridia bacterium]
MKKIFAIVMTVAMLLSLGAVVASAAEVPPVSWTPGNFAVADPSDFTPVGDVKITWDAEAGKKLDLSDGDMAEWAEAGYNMITIDAANMVSWVGGAAGEVDPGMPANWSISTYFVADADYLYIGFYVTDPAFAYGTDAGSYNGDAFQVCIDFGGKLGQVVVEDPDRVTNPKNIFYSFTCLSDGAPIQIMRQESDQDGLLSEENGDGVKGAAKKTDTGWSAEFALSWDQMYNDYLWKAWEEDKKIYVGSDELLPLKIGCALYYLDRSEPGGGINWAAGTSNGQLLEDDVTPGVSWTCYDNGIQAKLEYEEGITFNCEGIVVLPVTETTPEETTAEETTAEETEAPTTAAPETEAPTDPATEAPTTADTTAEATEGGKDGCGSVIGFGVIAVLAAAAAAVALKKD